MPIPKLLQQPQVMMELPCAKPDARPAAVTLAMPDADELQFAVCVRSFVEPSE